jgi:hypothetical protein
LLSSKLSWPFGAARGGADVRGHEHPLEVEVRVVDAKVAGAEIARAQPLRHAEAAGPSDDPENVLGVEVVRHTGERSREHGNGHLAATRVALEDHVPGEEDVIAGRDGPPRAVERVGRVVVERRGGAGAIAARTSSPASFIGAANAATDRSSS